MADLKISSPEVRKIVSGGKGEGFEVGLRDISFAVLSMVYDDPFFAFRAIYGDVPEFSFADYTASPKTQWVIERVRQCEVVRDTPKEREAGPGDEGLSYDEIKKGLEEDLSTLIELRNQRDEDGNPTLEPKEMATVVGRIADIRVKLTEKFGTVNREEDQRVVVMQKFDSICPYCNHEIAVRPKQ